MKFQWDNSKIILTDHGQQVLELYKEYLNASELVKKAIINHIKSDYRIHFSRISSWIDGGIPLESFENNLKGLKGYTKSNISKEKYEAAREFIDSHLIDIDFITSDEKISRDVIIVRKMIGIKSTTVRKYFVVPDKMTDKEFFDKNLDHIKWFMGHYVRKLVESGNRITSTSKGYVDTVKALKNSGVNIKVSPAIEGRYVNIYVDYEINLDDLSSEILGVIKNDINLLDDSIGI